MTLITPEERISRTAELLHSVHESVRKLRQQATDLCQQLEAGEDANIGNASREVASVEGLIKTCQKVEASLEEQHNRQAGIVRGGYAVDLDVARFEVGCRLARLRTCCDP